VKQTWKERGYKMQAEEKNISGEETVGAMTFRARGAMDNHFN
jgi:hypothetical protein